MKSIAILILSIFCFSATAQTIKISELPEHTGNPSAAHAPIVTGGVTKKYSLGNFVYIGSTYSNPAWLTGLHPNKLLQAGATTGQVLLWNGSAFAPGTLGGTLPSQTGNAGKYLTTNGTSTSWATITSVSNIGNSNLRLTSDRSLSGGGTTLGYSFTFDSLKSFNLTRPSTGLDYFYADQSGRLTLTGENGNNNLDIDRFGGFEWSSTNNAGGNPIRFFLNSEVDTATLTFSNTTKIKVDKVNPNNGSPYKPLVKNVATGIVEYVDAVIIDTIEIATKAYVNYKDDIQQTFIDYRKLDIDSSGWTGYTSRARTQQIIDSMKAKDLIRDDTLSVHNTRTLANTNSINNLTASKLTASDTSFLARKRLRINFQTASYTLVAADENTLVLMNVASANNLTMPPTATPPFALGSNGSFTSYGAGQTTIVAGSGVTLRTADGATKTRVTYSSGTWIVIGTNEYLIIGDII